MKAWLAHRRRVLTEKLSPIGDTLNRWGGAKGSENAGSCGADPRFAVQTGPGLGTEPQLSPIGDSHPLEGWWWRFRPLTAMGCPGDCPGADL